MDRKSIEAAYIVKGMTDRHFNGGAYSDEVRVQFETIKDLAETEKEALYVETFKKAMALVHEIAEHPRYNNDIGEVDLTDEGMGVIHISAGFAEEDSGDFAAYNSVEVHVESFEPVAEAHIRWGDPVFGGMEGIEYNKQGPIDFEDGIYLNTDGTIQDAEMPIDPKIMKALDFIETLTAVQSVLNPPKVPAQV